MGRELFLRVRGGPESEQVDNLGVGEIRSACNKRVGKDLGLSAAGSNEYALARPDALHRFFC
jgi:hypothetical protein